MFLRLYKSPPKCSAFFFHTQDFKELFFNPLKKKSFFSVLQTRYKAKNNLSKEVLKTLQRTSPTSAEKSSNFSAEVGQLHT
jgi:hypothetical protein